MLYRTKMVRTTECIVHAITNNALHTSYKEQLRELASPTTAMLPKVPTCHSAHSPDRYGNRSGDNE